MNNLLSYCGFTHARMNPSEKDLPVPWIVLYSPTDAVLSLNSPSIYGSGILLSTYVPGKGNLGQDKFG